MFTLFISWSPVCFWGVVLYFQSMPVNQKALAKAGTSVSKGGSPPASNNKTRTHGISVRRLATTEPAEPAPTAMWEREKHRKC